MEPCGATVGNVVSVGEAVFAAKLSPIVLVVLGQHKHDVHLLVILAKAAYGVHEHGHAVDGDKLLRYVAAHAQAFSSCHDNGVVHLLFLLDYKESYLHIKYHLSP